MDSSHLDLSDPQRAMAGFAEQQDEDMLLLDIQPPDATLAMRNHVYNQTDMLGPHQQYGLGTTSIFQPRVHDHPWTTQGEPSHSFQQPPAAMTRSNYMQESQLSNQALLELTMEDIRHSEERARILERSQACSIVHPQHHHDHPHNNTGFDYFGDVDGTSTIYNSLQKFSNTQMVPKQTAQGMLSMNDDWNSFSNFRYPWPIQTPPQAASCFLNVPNYAQNHHLLNNTSSYMQNNDPSIMYPPRNFMQPTTEPIPLESLTHNPLDPFSIAHSPESLTPHYGIPTYDSSTQSPFPSTNGTPLPADAYASSTTFDMALDHGMAVDFTALPSYANMEHLDRHTPSIIPTDFPSYSATSLLNVPDLNIERSGVLTTTSQTQITVGKPSRNRRKTAGPELPKHHSGINNQFFHTTPAADRRRRKELQRTREVSERSAWSCAVCWILHGKCKHLSEGPCEGCSKILRAHADLTRVQKFACTPRTKFSDVKIYTIPPMKPSFYFAIDENTATLSNSSLGKTMTRDMTILPLDIVAMIALTCFAGFRNLLDVIEPRHERQLWPQNFNVLTYLSYSFSMIRWRKVILYLHPSMEEIVDLFEQLHHWRLQQVLASLDEPRFYKEKKIVVFAIIVLVEGICSMEPSSTVDSSEKNRLLFLLQDRLSCLLYMVLPPSRTVNKVEREGLQRDAAIFNTHMSISRLLPPDYHDCSPIWMEKVILSTHRNSSGTQWGSSMDTSYINCQKPPKPSDGPISNLLMYVPARVLAAFGLNAERLLCIVHDVKNPHHGLVCGIEEILEGFMMTFPPLLLDEFLLASSVALAFGIGVAFGAPETNKDSKDLKVPLLVLAILVSTFICELFKRHMQEELHAGKGLWLHNSFPSFSIAICSWVEETGLLQRTTQSDMKFIEVLLGEGELDPSSKAIFRL